MARKYDSGMGGEYRHGTYPGGKKAGIANTEVKDWGSPMEAYPMMQEGGNGSEDYLSEKDMIAKKDGARLKAQMMKQMGRY